MPYAPAQLVLKAVEALSTTNNPLAVVTLPALLRTAKAAGVDPVAQPVPFGSTEETEFLDEFFALPRPPDPDRPWRAPWSTNDPWQKRKYPGGSLQRQRTDASRSGRVFQQRKRTGESKDTWQLTPSAGAELVAANPDQKTVRLIDLAIWMGRDQDVADLQALRQWFIDEFSANVGDLIGTVYNDEIPEDYLNVPFASEPIDEATYERLGSLPEAPTVGRSLGDLVSALEDRLTKAGYQLPPGLVRRVLTAWLRGDMVVLVGQPGTGKTMFAGLLGRAMQKEIDLDAPLLIPIRSDFDEAEFIGYERLDGTPQLRDFATNVLQTSTSLEARVIVLEEFNLAAVESYMASVLVASQEQERLIRLPAGEQRQLPIDTFILATCNSYRDEPETRMRVSSPTKRRASIITMPNVLADLYDDNPDNVLTAAMNLINTERDRVKARVEALRSAQFDSLREAALDTVHTLDDLSAKVKDSVKEVCAAILATPVGRSWFTLGLLRDVVMAIVHADRNEDAELEALGRAVADKLVHQVRGTHADVEELRGVCAGFPNAGEIDSLLQRMMDGPADELLPLL